IASGVTHICKANVRTAPLNNLSSVKDPCVKPCCAIKANCPYYFRRLGGLDGDERPCNCDEHQRAANRCEDKCFHSNLQVWNPCGRLLPVQACHWESPVVRTHQVRWDRREKRGLKSITNSRVLRLYLQHHGVSETVLGNHR